MDGPLSRQRPLVEGVGDVHISIMPQKRPAHLKPPAHLSTSPPVPKPAPMVRAPEPDPDRPDPVRYGDWELKGIAVDF